MMSFSEIPMVTVFKGCEYFSVNSGQKNPQTNTEWKTGNYVNELVLLVF